ncbi:hypothetical protein CFT13S00388_02725 [Campylobacter fetus subsp. testudinum]|uniref:HU family DNA-binding protein n=1 Tax=Campylobacter fetus TaxID=196 RepID=UPI00081878BD|nr:HU family DNA-binding protein [Campylobacter fetus]OCR88097.1 hypothetical protein CFT13S00388_02725 [Campylobacter fetus subsp. testudinum]
MNKKELINKVSKLSGENKKDVSNILDSILEAIIETTKEGKSIKLKNFGIFKPVTREGYSHLAGGKSYKINTFRLKVSSTQRF